MLTKFLECVNVTNASRSSVLRGKGCASPGPDTLGSRSNAEGKAVDRTGPWPEIPAHVSASVRTPEAPRIPWWLWLNVLSLDAPIVAVLWQMALARAHRVVLMPQVHQALFLAVWLIYMLDRVLDGFSVQKGAQLSARHDFYRRHRWLFLLVIIPFGTMTLLLLATTAIPSGILWRGVSFSFIVALYLLHYAARGNRPIYIIGNLLACGIGGLVLWALPLPVHFKLLYGTVLLALLVLAFSGALQSGFRLLPKELLCGYLFAVGCSLGVNFFTGDLQAHPFSMETLLLALLCGLNCIAISCYERDTDAQNDPNAISQTWPHIARVYPTLLLTLAVLAGCALSRRLPVELLLYSLAVLLSTVLLGVVHHVAKRITPELAHVLADAALAGPILVLAVAW